MSTDSISYAVEREWKPEAPRSAVIPHSLPSLYQDFGRPFRSQSSSTYPYTRPRACPRILLVDCRQFCFSIAKAKKAMREQIDF